MSPVVRHGPLGLQRIGEREVMMSSRLVERILHHVMMVQLITGQLIVMVQVIVLLLLLVVSSNSR